MFSIDKLPEDNYSISKKDYSQLDSNFRLLGNENGKIMIEVIQKDNEFSFKDLESNILAEIVRFDDIKKLSLSRLVLDFDVITIPFKIRPSVKGFPEQMNATFNGALYLGKRKDRYTIEKKNDKIKLNGFGFGYGAFLGVGSVTMNPFVLQETINYEYDGFVVQGGLAGIYDAKRFNFGLATGVDMLMDKNRKNWIYQGKPWIGMLFGIQLN